MAADEVLIHEQGYYYIIMDRDKEIGLYYTPVTYIPTPESTIPPTGIPTTPPLSEKGDVNGDKIIDIIDALLTAQYYVELNPANFDVNYADVNCDGEVDIVDALLIAQFYVELITEFC